MLWEGERRGPSAKLVGLALALAGLLILGVKLARRGLLPGFHGNSSVAAGRVAVLPSAAPGSPGAAAQAPDVPVERAVSRIPPVQALKVVTRRPGSNVPVPSPSR